MRGIRIDPETKRRAIELYRITHSTLKVAGELGVSHETVRILLIRSNEPRRDVGRPEIYPKTNFSGNPAERAMLLGFTEDCSVVYHGKQIRITTTTTHPAQIELFDDGCARYGHVGRTPGYHRRYSLYEWQVYVHLNPTFNFVIEYKKNPLKFLDEIAENGNVYDYIGGLSNAESWVGIDANGGHPLAALSIYNNDRRILEWTQRTIGGTILPSRNTFELRLRREKAVVEAVRILPLMHTEKVAAKELILRHYDNRGIGLEALREYRELRRRIDDEVQLCTLQARLEFIRRHEKPHPKDPDQTIPPI